MNRRDPLADKIQMSLQNLSTNQSPCSIFKVPGVLRSVNNRAYEPKILSIGPYHQGKDDFKMMEEHKKRYLKMFLQRRQGNSLTSYVEAMRGLEGVARPYYQQPVSLGTDAFVEMLVLDGCFIVELICKITMAGVQQGDRVTGNSLVLSTVSHDMLLLENQIPFCVLLKLFSMAMPHERDPFIFKASRFFKWMFPGSRLETSNIISSHEFKHLLDFVYHNWLLPSPPMLPRESEAQNKKSEFIRSAKELKEAGIKFGKQEESIGIAMERLAEQDVWDVARKKGIDLVVVNPVVVFGPLLQPTINASNIHILKDVALAHILVFKTPSASGRYICSERLLHHGECSNEKNPRKQSYKLTNQKIKDLAIKFIPMK
ncbi:hypothetical protein SADUNF_Sadunf01G0034100 [Salix dunnii]|uniref:Uncharacterized protein n=1 Tax=Salix dunnii TaxID=1413687 RepID=A0A835N9S5_9ROSI|nr:hypothetical protein SADUNF_Sadunf01G0034100 [Salix dunnii]